MTQVVLVTLSRRHREVGLALTVLAQVALAEGDFERAERLFDESEELLRAAGSWWGLSANLSIRAITTAMRGDHARTVTLVRESLALARSACAIPRTPPTVWKVWPAL